MSHQKARKQLLQVSRDFEARWRELRDLLQGEAEFLSRFDSAIHMQGTCEYMEAELERTFDSQRVVLSQVTNEWFSASDKLAEASDDPDLSRRLRRECRDARDAYMQTNVELSITYYWRLVYVDVCERATKIGWDHRQASRLFQGAIRDNMRLWGPVAYMQALCSGKDAAAMAALVGSHTARTKIFARYRRTLDLLVKEQYSAEDGFDPATAHAQAKYDIVLETILDDLGNWAFKGQEQEVGDQPMISLDEKHWPDWDRIPGVAMKRVDQEGKRRAIEQVSSDLVIQVADGLAGTTIKTASHALDPEQILLLTEELNENSALLHRFGEAIDMLPQRDREIIDLHLKGLSRRKIAHAIGMPEGTTRTHLDRSLDKIARALTGQPRQKNKKII